MAIQNMHLFSAPMVKDPGRLVPALSYVGAYNAIDFPVGSVPVDVFTKQDEVNMSIG